jgi:hypothetical protein
MFPSGYFPQGVPLRAFPSGYPLQAIPLKGAPLRFSILRFELLGFVFEAPGLSTELFRSEAATPGPGMRVRMIYFVIE